MLTVPNAISLPPALLQQADLDAIDIAQLAQASGGTGVISGCDLVLTGGMGIQVNPGTWCINGTLYSLGATFSATLTSDPVQTYIFSYRFSTVGLSYYTAANENSVNISPTYPVYGAMVFIPPGTTTLTSAMVIDKRAMLDSRVWPRPYTAILQTPGAYTLAHNEIAIIKPNGPGDFTLTLPPTTAKDTTVTVKLASAPYPVNITIQAPDGALIDGQTTLVLTDIYQSVTLISTVYASTSQWIVV